MNTRGFTLLETIMYLGLFSLLLGGSVPAAYQLSRGADQDSRAAIAEDEAAFIDRKLYWALSSATTVTTPTPNVLIITRGNGADTLTFSRTGTTLTLRRGDTPAVTLTSADVVIGDVTFIVQPSTDDATGAAVAHIAADDIPFAFRYALPKTGLFPDACARP